MEWFLFGFAAIMFSIEGLMERAEYKRQWTIWRQNRSQFIWETARDFGLPVSYNRPLQ